MAALCFISTAGLSTLNMLTNQGFFSILSLELAQSRFLDTNSFV